MNNGHRDIQGIKRIVQQIAATPPTPGRVLAKLPRGVRVQITGSNLTVEADIIRGADVQVGDEVVLMRPEGQRRWIVVGAAANASANASSISVSSSVSNTLAPPDGVRAYDGWGYILFAWSAPIQRPDINFQVQVEDDTEGSTNIEHFATTGSSYLYIAPPGVRKRFRVCTVDKNYNKSGWSAPVVGESRGIYFSTGLSTTMPDPATRHEGEPFYAFDTRTLYVVHNEVWEAVAGGGGDSSVVDPGLGPGYWDPTLPPEQPNELDNEFTSAWVDWQFQFPADGTNVIVSNGMAIMQGTSYAIEGLLRKNLPETPWTVTVRARLSNDIPDPDQAHTPLLSIFVASEEPERTIGSFEAAGFAFMHLRGEESLNLFHIESLTADTFGLNGFGDNAWPRLNYGQWAYVRLRRPSNNKLFVDFSTDGMAWFSRGGTSNLNPTWIGISYSARRPDSLQQPNLEIDFVRFSNTAHEPSDPVFGRWVGTNLSSEANVVGDVVPFTHLTASPVELGDVEAGDHIHACKVFIDTPFDGVASLSVGEPGAPGRLIDASMIDPKEAGLYEAWPEYTYAGPASIHLYLSKSGVTQGSGRVILIRKERYNG